MKRVLSTAALAVALLGPSTTDAKAAALPASMPQGVYTFCEPFYPATAATRCDFILDEAQSLGLTRVIIQPKQSTLVWPDNKIALFESMARARGIKVVWSLPYRQTADRARFREVVTYAKTLPNTLGFYIADEPGQLAGENYADERVKVQNWAFEIKQTLAADQPTRNRVYTVHFACQAADVNVVQKPYTTLANVDAPMVDCYPYDRPLSEIELTLFNTYNKVFDNDVAVFPSKFRAVVGQAFSWDTEPGGSPNGLHGWPTQTAVRIMRDCGFLTNMQEYWWFSQSVWRKFNPTWATNTFGPAIATAPETHLCDGA